MVPLGIVGAEDLPGQGGRRDSPFASVLDKRHHGDLRIIASRESYKPRVVFELGQVALQLFLLFVSHDLHGSGLPADIEARECSVVTCPPVVDAPPHPCTDLLGSLRIERKLPLGGWFDAAFRLLAGLKRLRGTALDPFGGSRVRRLERHLVGWYRETLAAGLERLEPAGVGVGSRRRWPAFASWPRSAGF